MNSETAVRKDLTTGAAEDLTIVFVARWLLRQGLQCCVRSWLRTVKPDMVTVRHVNLCMWLFMGCRQLHMENTPLRSCTV